MTSVVGLEIKLQDALECLKKDPLFSVKLEEKYSPYWCKDGVVYFSDFRLNNVERTWNSENHFWEHTDAENPRKCYIHQDPNHVYLNTAGWSKEAPEVF